MAEIDMTEVLRAGLLDGVPIALAHAGPAGSGESAAGSAPSVIGAACTELGAVVHELPLICTGQPEADDAELDRALAAMPAGAGEVRMLVLDAGGLFARLATETSHGAGGPGAASGDRAGAQAGAQADALIATLEASWRVTRAVAGGAFIPEDAGGRIVYLAPPTLAAGDRREPDASAAHADAARAGLENLARTLSIEWARYGITPVTIAPGPRTTPGELAGVVAYLASPAGDYFSGCELDLRGSGC
jgi:NAD(P)-dependent dehydrogenase (short-subunit alcohol dehydrogenase family)